MVAGQSLQASDHLSFQLHSLYSKSAPTLTSCLMNAEDFDVMTLFVAKAVPVLQEIAPSTKVSTCWRPWLTARIHVVPHGFTSTGF